MNNSCDNPTGDYPWTNVVEGDRIYAMSGNMGIPYSTSSLTATVTVGDNSSVNPTGDYFAVDNVVVTGLITVAQGDVDGDGNVNIADVTALIDYLLSGNATGISLSAADVNGDGSINISDVTSLIDFLLNGNWW